jgi:hypothetical protein
MPEDATSAPSIQNPCIIQLLMNPNGVDDVRFHLAHQSSKAMFFFVFPFTIGGNVMSILPRQIFA